MESTSNHKDTDREMIFFGLSSIKFNPLPINAAKIPYVESKILDKRTPQSIKDSILLKLPMNYLGKDYIGVYNPCIPQIRFTNTAREEDAQEGVLQHPFIKAGGEIKESEDYKICIPSGRRSAIAKFKDGHYYRFKGCGDLNMGFWLKEMRHPKGGREIRGCMFENTVLCELHMSQKIQGFLQEYGIECTNKSVGYWVYPQETPLYKQYGLKNEGPLIDKICGVFRTLGERRVGTHLVQGLNMLTWIFLQKFNSTMDFQAIKDMFPKCRHYVNKKDKSVTITSTYDTVMMYFLEENQDNPVSIHEFCKNPIYKPETYKELFDPEMVNKVSQKTVQEFFKDDSEFVEMLFPVKSNEELKAMKLIDTLQKSLGEEQKEQKKIVEQVQGSLSSYFDLEYKNEMLEQEKGKKPYPGDDNNMHPRWRLSKEMMDSVQDLLRKILKDGQSCKSSVLEILVKLRLRLGFEMGRIFRIFQNNDLNWGFFADHDPYGLHQNAHMNNFVVLPPNWQQKGNFLSVLDFDLAFFRKDFCHLLQDEDNLKAFMTADDGIFDQYMNNQRHGLECGISGAENMNFLYNTVDFGQNRDMQSRKQHRILLHIMNDAMIRGFRMAYDHPDKNTFQLTKQESADAYLLIELALLLTHDQRG